MAVSAAERFHLKKLVKELEGYRGRHTELVTVYVPAGYELTKIIQHLAQEQGTASNIKSTATRKNVTDALERMIQHLRLFKGTPKNGLVVYSGNVAEREGQSDVRVWSFEPPVPLNQRLYRCDKEFVLDALREMVQDKTIYGLVVVDRRDAMIAILQGKTIVPLLKTHSETPGKFRAGGQCLVPNTVVQLADGSLPPIKIVHNPNIVKSVMITDNFSQRNSNITAKWKTQKHAVYTIITKYPRLELQASADHTFFVVTDDGIAEKPSAELREHDCLLMLEKININGRLQHLLAKKYHNAFFLSKNGRALLKRKRLARRLSQYDLAAVLGVTQTTISSYETGKLEAADRDALRHLCRALNIPFQHFLTHFTHQRTYRGTAVSLPDTLSPMFAQFLGYLVGDGCIETDRVTFFEQERDVALRYKKRFDRFFRIDSTYKFRSSKNYHQLRFTSRPLVRLIREEFPEIRKTADSTIPQKILQSPDTVLAAFLRGLFDADGYATLTRGVALGINNKLLAQQVQMALLRFSVIGSLQEYDNRANAYSDNPRFTVDITEKRSLELFSKHIGFTAPAKTRHLRILLKRKSTISRVRRIVVPGRNIRAMLENAGYRITMFPKVTNFFRNERMMSKEVFRNSILPHVKDRKLYRKLAEICEYPVLPVKVSKIVKKHTTTPMFDISVRNQNFIANGILVHNSSARFARQRELAIKHHFKKVADYLKEQFLNMEGLKGIIVGGPGPSKYDFVDTGYITGDVKKKIIGIKDLSYTEEFGLQELLDKSQDLLANEEVAEEKKAMAQFFEQLAKKPGMVSYGKATVKQHLQASVVDTILLSEALEDSEIEEFEELAKKYGTNVKIISLETREGAQLKDLGKVAAMLRYEIGEYA